jgi:hypothetical protein
MSVATLTPANLATAHEQFEAALPRMESAFRHAFRRWPGEHRREAVAEARAAAWSAWHGLVRRGQDPLAVGVMGIAHNAVRNVLQGRRVGNRTKGRGALDIHDARAQRRTGLRIFSLDRTDESTTGAAAQSWRDWLAENNRVSPADEAAFRLDFAQWLAGLPERKRQMAELLLQGHEIGAVAKLLSVTSPAVSQARSYLEASWKSFQGEAGAAEAAPGPRPVGRPRKAQGSRCRPRQQDAVPAMAAGS